RSRALPPGAVSPGNITAGHASHGGGHLVADARGILGARIVVGDDDEIGAVGRGGAHEGAFGAVAVAAGAEDGDDPAGGGLPERVEDGGDRLGLVGVVDHAADGGRAGDQFHAAGHAGAGGDAGERVDEVDAHRFEQGRGEGGVGDVVASGHVDAAVGLAGGSGQDEGLGEAVGLDVG